MKLGLTSAAFYGRMETEDAAAFLQAFGLDTCEVFLETPSEYTADFGQLVRGKLGALGCTSVHPKGTQFEPDLFGQSARQRDDALSIMRGVMDAGQVLGAKYYVFHGPVSVVGRITLDKIRLLEKRFGAMQDMAHARGMEILWENVYYGAVSGIEDFREICTRMPGTGFVLDLKQAWRGHVDPMDVVREMGPHIRHVHILDRDENGNICLPGEGQFDFAALLEQLKAHGFDGSVIIEPYAYQTTDIDAVKRSVGYMREIIAKVGG